MRKHTRKKPIAEINVVPYIDVMLVLLVIFMITTPLLTRGVSVDLPKAQAKVVSTKQQEPIIVTVDKRGLLYLNIASKPFLPLSPKRIAIRIAAELAINRNRQVLVKGDRRAIYGQVVEAMVLLQQAGVPRVGLLTSDQKTKLS